MSDVLPRPRVKVGQLRVFKHNTGQRSVYLVEEIYHETSVNPDVRVMFLHGAIPFGFERVWPISCAFEDHVLCDV